MLSTNIDSDSDSCGNQVFTALLDGASRFVVDSGRLEEVVDKCKITFPVYHHMLDLVLNKQRIMLIINGIAAM